MSIAEEYVCTGNFDEVAARMRAALAHGDVLRGDICENVQNSELQFEVRDRLEVAVRLLHPRARGRIIANGEVCVARYLIGPGRRVQAVLIAVGVMAGLLTMASYLDYLPIERMMMVPGGLLILSFILINELHLFRKSRWLNRKLTEYLKG